MDETQRELVRLLSEREGVLGRLREGPASRAALVDDLDSSRSTVDRAVRELARHGLVARGSRECRLTLLGRLVLEEYVGFEERLVGLLEGRLLVEALPDDVELPATLFDRADVVEPTQVAPYLPLERCLQDVARADRARLVATDSLSRYLGLFDDGTFVGGGTVELGLSSSAVRSLLSDRPDWFVTAIRGDDVTLFELDDDPPFTAGVLEFDGRSVATLTVSETDGVWGYLTSGAPSAVDWMASFVDGWCERGTRVSPSER